MPGAWDEDDNWFLGAWRGHALLGYCGHDHYEDDDGEYGHSWIRNGRGGLKHLGVRRGGVVTFIPRVRSTEMGGAFQLLLSSDWFLGALAPVKVLFPLHVHA